jgi:hypothetical protein
MNTVPDEPESGAGKPKKRERPVMPTADEAAAEVRPADERPAPVRYSFVVWVLAGIVAVGNAAVLLANKQDLIDTMMRTKDPNITNEQVVSGATTLLWIFMIGAVVFGLLFALFAYKAQEGHRRARVILAVLCAVTVAFYLIILPTALGLLVAMLSVVATVLLFVPAANAFFRPPDLPA